MQSKELDTWLYFPTPVNKMEIILLETFNKIGKAGEIVSVKDGFANNFLIPMKKAIIANKKNRNDLASKMSQINDNNLRKINEATELKSKLEGKEITIQIEANEEGNLYGNLSAKQIYESFRKEHLIEFDTANIITTNINKLCEHIVTLRLYDEISVDIKLNVIKKV